MDVNLQGKVAIVTGAAQGIGRAIAMRAATSQAVGLLLTDRGPLAETAAEISNKGVQVETLSADLEEEDAPERIVAACLERLGAPHALVNCAALTDRATVTQASSDVYDRLYRVNQRAPAILMGRCIEQMKLLGGASIVNILTMNIHGGSPPTALYASTKAALALLTRNAAHEHRFDHIRINGIAVGWVDTPGERLMQRETYQRGEDYFAAKAAERPMGRLLEPDDVARLALFLLSDASIPVTGSIIDQEQWVSGARD